MTTTSSHSSTNQPIEKMNDTKMSKCDVIPWEQKAIGAGDVGLLLGLSSATVLQKSRMPTRFARKKTYKARDLDSKGNHRTA